MVCCWIGVPYHSGGHHPAEDPGRAHVVVMMMRMCQSGHVVMGQQVGHLI